MPDVRFVKVNVTEERTAVIIHAGKKTTVTYKVYKDTAVYAGLIEDEIYVSKAVLEESLKFSDVMAYGMHVTRGMLQSGFPQKEARRAGKKQAADLAKEMRVFGPFAGYLKDHGIDIIRP